MEAPLVFDFDFDMDDFKPTDESYQADIAAPRSPRTPTHMSGGDPSTQLSSTPPPFDPERFFRFPLLSTSQESSPLSPSVRIPAPTRVPLVWIWTCHLCRSRYPLGATRRCLVDGHFYCSGEHSGVVAQKNVKRKKRGLACSSEFDYVGWQEWGNWKRRLVSTRQLTRAGTKAANATSGMTGCQLCEYPSQCRYEKMNKVPEVVAAVSRSADQQPVDRVKRERGSDRKTVDVKVERMNLKIETRSLRGQNRKTQDRHETEFDAKTSSSAECKSKSFENYNVTADPASLLHKNYDTSNERCSDPESPDLVDLSTVATKDRRRRRKQSSREKQGR